MVIPQGVNIPMPKPFGGIPPAISKTPLGEDAAGGELITVSLVGEIGPITQYLEVFEVLDTATEKDQVRIVLDTPGGDVYTTQQIVGRMESCKAKVTTVASGLVASAGTFIWLYGQEQEIERWARFMFHSSLHGDWGKSLTIKENATELVKFMASILSDAEKRGILLAAEVQQILKGKADLELSAGTVKARKRRRWVDEEGAEQPSEGDDNSAEEPTEGDEGGEGGEEPTETPEAKAKKLTKKKVIKKTKKRIASAEGDDGEGTGEEEPTEGDDGAGEGEEATEPAPEETTIEDIFSTVCEENGVENPEPVEPTEGDDGEGAPEGKKGGKKKGKKRKAEGEEEPGEGETTEETTEEPGEGETAGEGEGEGEGAPAAKKGKKKAKKRRRAEGDDGEVCPDCGNNPCTCGDDDDDDDGGEGETTETTEETVEETPVEDIFDTICEENGVEIPTEEPGEGDDDGDDDDDDDDDGDDGDDGDDAGEGAPSAKCSKHGKKKKAKKPAKKRRSEGGENITTGTDNDADKNSHLRKVPSNRFW